MVSPFCGALTWFMDWCEHPPFPISGYSQFLQSSSIKIHLCQNPVLADQGEQEFVPGNLPRCLHFVAHWHDSWTGVNIFLFQHLVIDVIEVLMFSPSFQRGFIIFKILLFICGCDYKYCTSGGFYLTFNFVSFLNCSFPESDPFMFGKMV
jgi:hypothetical protein